MNLSAISKHLVGRGYDLGTMDCFSLTLEYLILRGCEIPEEFMGQTRDTYADLFLSDPKKAKSIMIKFMEHYTDEIPASKCFAGDMVLMSSAGSLPFLAIDGGNGNCIGATECSGVRVLPMRFYDIEKVFRWRKAQ